MASWIIVAVVFVLVVVWYGWHSTHNELTKKIDRESDPEIRSELLDRGRPGSEAPTARTRLAMLLM